MGERDAELVETRPSAKQIKRWRRYLADERAEAALYRELARSRSGQERDILLKLAAAESRHEEYWRDKLGDEVGMPIAPGLGTRFKAWLARRFGWIVVLAMMQNAETRTPYLDDDDASDQIAADERIHAEVVRGLAARGRERMSGGFRAAVFGANDGLVSNLALVLGVLGTGLPSGVVLATGISGLLAGALSMAAGEYISVRSQAELVEASEPSDDASAALPALDVDANELALVYRARGMGEEAAEERARETLAAVKRRSGGATGAFPGAGRRGGEDAPADGALVAAASSFCCFASGALLPVLPFAFGASTGLGAVVACVVVALALACTGALTGVLSGKPPLRRALRQLAVGLGAALVTWAIGLAFGQVAG